MTASKLICLQALKKIEMQPLHIPYPPCVPLWCFRPDFCHACSDSKCCAFDGKYKYEWPELVGVAAQEAKATIIRDNPLVTVVLVPPGYIMDDNFCCNRVWLQMDEANIVKKMPVVR